VCEHGKDLSLVKSFVFKCFRILFLFFIVILSGCSSTPADEGLADSRDPFEVINRPLWTFTWDYADKFVTKPAAELYTTYTPPLLRTGLYNMALNLNEPSSIINNLLQFKLTAAAKTTGRFVLNSTVGLLGFYDPASDYGWTSEQEEFGEVLGRYGIGDGPYLILPILGPSSVREEVGDYVDRLYWPLVVFGFWPNVFRLGIIGLERRASIRDQEQLLVESTDSYEFIKNAYFQNMNYRLYDGSPPIIIDEDQEAEIDALLEEFDDFD